MANICLNLFNMTCHGNYSLRHYCSIFIGSHLLRHLAPTSFVFHSVFRHQQVNNQNIFPPSQSLRHDVWVCSFSFLFSYHHLVVDGLVKVRDLLPVVFGTYCSLAASLCFDPFTSPKMLMSLLYVTFVLVY